MFGIQVDRTIGWLLAGSVSGALLALALWLRGSDWRAQKKGREQTVSVHVSAFAVVASKFGFGEFEGREAGGGGRVSGRDSL